MPLSNPGPLLSVFYKTDNKFIASYDQTTESCANSNISFCSETQLNLPDYSNHLMITITSLPNYKRHNTVII